MSVKIYHNPRCRKSRETLDLIREAGHEPQIIEYLKTPPTIAELEDILSKMGDKHPRDIMRTKEAAYKDLGLQNKEIVSIEELLHIMIENPILIERPIVITEKGAALGRPPEDVKAIL